MRKLISLISLTLILSVCLPVFADKFIIDFPCYPLQLQEEFAKFDRRLELNGEYRDRNTWGFLINEGTRYTIVTYHSASYEDMDIIMEVSDIVELKMRGEYEQDDS